MTDSAIETIYDALATAIDTVGPAQSEVLLAKIALVLAQQLNDPQTALRIIADCQRGLGNTGWATRLDP